MFKKSNVGPLGAENDDSRLKIGLIVARGAQYLAQKYITSRVKNLEFQPQTARICTWAVLAELKEEGNVWVSLQFFEILLRAILLK